MQGQIHTELGSILIDADVVATYAGSVALGCSGIVGMASLDTVSYTHLGDGEAISRSAPLVG